MTIEEVYKKVQKEQSGLYTLFVLDLKNSSTLLKTKFGRKMFQDTYYELKKFLIDKPVIDIEDDGVKRQIIRKGDLFAITTVSIKADELEKYLDEFLEGRELFFHKGRCMFQTIDSAFRKYDLYFMDAIPILEDTIKNRNLELGEISNETKNIELNLQIEVEEWLDKDFVESELLYLLAQYGWNGKIKKEEEE
jgi:hypothetical protein